MRCAWRSRRGGPPTSPVACPGARSRCRPRRSKGCWIKDATAARRAALRILQSVRSGASFAAARDRHLSGLAERDRRLAYQLAGGVLRSQADLDRALALATVDPRLDDILRLGAYQLRALARVPAYAAVSTSVELARDAAGEGGARFVNQALRRLARETGNEKREPCAHTHPEWLVARWRRWFGTADVARLLAWNDSKPQLTLQPARWDRDTLLLRLREAGIGARVVAGDARRDRMAHLVQTVRRAGVAIRLAVADLLAAPCAAGALAAVLVDAPCTATGTMARHPDARWRISARAIDRAAARQRALLEAAGRVVQSRGLLVYATCSLEPEENSDVVNDFLERHPEFRRDAPPPGTVPAELLTEAGDFQSIPQRHGIDGAYAARLVRVR